MTKAAALLQSLARNDALVDGNKCAAWAAAWTFLFINGTALDEDFDVDEAEDSMNAVASGLDSELDEIVEKLRRFASPGTK